MPELTAREAIGYFLLGYLQGSVFVISAAFVAYLLKGVVGG